MATTENMENAIAPARQSPVTCLGLFSIGLSAGLIAAIFPRLVALLGSSGGGSEINIQFLSTGFMLVAVVFGVVVGVSMIWLNKGTSESTKNLFMSALALPGILSGGLSMSNSTAEFKQEFLRVQAQQEALAEQVQNTAEIPVLEDLIDFEPVSFLDNSGMPDQPILFEIIPAAHAADTAANNQTRLAQGVNLNPGIQYKSPKSAKSYVVVLGQAKDKEDVLQQQKQYLERGIDGVEAKKSEGAYFLTKGKPQSKSGCIA